MWYFLWIQSTLVRKAGNEQVEEGGEIEISLIHFSSCQLSFYSGLNFIVKVFHNQNFMLAPPLSFNRHFVAVPCIVFKLLLSLVSESPNLLSPVSTLFVYQLREK